MTQTRFSFGHKPLFKPEPGSGQAANGTPVLGKAVLEKAVLGADQPPSSDRSQTKKSRPQEPVPQKSVPKKTAAQKKSLAQALGQALAKPTFAATSIPATSIPATSMPAARATTHAAQVQPTQVQQSRAQQSPASPTKTTTKTAPQTPTKTPAKTPAQTAPHPKNGSLKRRVAALLAVITIIAVPAMAAPDDFGQLPGGAPTEAQLVREALKAELARNPAMPFERPGMSFPGSAFFFLAEPPKDALIALPTTDALALDGGLDVGEAGREVGALIDAGPGARPFFGTGGSSQTRASDCLAQAIWYEAASESEAGQRAVAQVVLNRVSHSSWPGSVCGVVYQGSNRSTGCQFTFTCDGSLRRKASGSTWQRAKKIASEALSGSVYEPIGHATHYHTLWINPYWASSLDHVGTIGAHRFYRNRGAGGQRSAFTQSYAGKEPGVRERVNAAPAPVTAPITPALPGAPSVASSASNGYTAPVTASSAPAQAGAQIGGPAPSRSAALTGPGSVRAGQGVSGAGQVRDDYASAGQWKSDGARAALQKEARRRAQEAAQSGGRASGQTDRQVSGQETRAPR